jgi:methylmalonyl-CoA mutase N-terminal domain/subunit
VEALTDELEAEAERLFEEIAAIGGVVPGIEAGWFQQQIAASAMRQQQEVESGTRTIVGVNDYVDGSEKVEIDVLRIDADVEERQRERMRRLRAERDDAEVERSLSALEAAARDGSNLVPRILDCARAYCTLYEIRHAMERVFGAYKEPVSF